MPQHKWSIKQALSVLRLNRNRYRSRVLMCVLMLMLTLMLTACGKKLAYNNLDWFAMRYVDDYVTLDSQQEAMFKKRLQYFLEWHRGRELTRYADQLLELKNLSEDDVNVAFIERQQRRLEQHWLRLIDRFSPDLLVMLNQLTTVQKTELLESLEKKYQKRNKKYQDMNEVDIRKKYEERIREISEEWLGSLTKVQAMQIKDWSNELMITTEFWREFRTRQYELMKQLFAAEQTVAQKKLFEQMLYQPDDLYSSEMREALDHNQAVFKRQLIILVGSMTEKQWQHYQNQLDEWYQLASDLSQSTQE